MKVKFRCFQLYLILSICLLARSDELNCLRQIEGGYFDFNPLEGQKDYVITNFTEDNPNIFIQFNICEFSTNKQCGGKSTIANLFLNKTDSIDCIRLSYTSKYEQVTYSLLDADRIAAGARMLFTGGDSVAETITDGDATWSPVSAETRTANASSTFSFALDLVCNRDITGDPTITGPTFDNTTFTYVVRVESVHSCPLLTLDEVSQFIEDNDIVFCIVGCILGLLIAFLGLKLFLPTLFLAGFISGFFICLFTFFGAVLTPSSRESTKWILVGFAVVLGSALGYITVKANKFGLFILGAWLGTIISLILYNAVLYKIETNPAEIVLLVTIGVLGLIGGLLSLKFYKHVVIISTSLGGSYAFVRALSLVIGYFPNEIQLINSIQLQDYSFSVEWPFYVYMNAIFLMTIFSIWVQIKLKRRTEANELEFDAQYFKKVDI